MATKQQAVRALKKHSSSATLIDRSDSTGFDVLIEAPAGHCWQGEAHSIAVGWWGCESLKLEYWGEVIGTIANLTPAVPCDPDECEYWID